MNPFDYSLKEVSAAIIAGLYLLFAIAILVFAVPIGLEAATVALVGPTFTVIAVFTSTEHSPMDLQKALEALKGVAVTFISFFVAVPASTVTHLSVVIVGLVGVVSIVWARSGKVSRTAVTRAGAGASPGAR
jgi:hypothetical protein